jgi:hypothetical protein
VDVEEDVHPPLGDALHHRLDHREVGLVHDALRRHDPLEGDAEADHVPAVGGDAVEVDVAQPARLVRRDERRRLPHHVHPVEEHDAPVLVHHERSITLELVRRHLCCGGRRRAAEEQRDDGDEEGPHGPQSRGRRARADQAPARIVTVAV